MVRLKKIAPIKSDFPAKFGIPRQSGLVGGAEASVVFEEGYRNPEALRGLEGFSHIWILWGFSASEQDGWSPTVRPPRLGGNVRVGVFASRSPYRPNPIGISPVKLEAIEYNAEAGPILHISGVDMMDGTPVYDIKPYVPTDSHPEAVTGFAAAPNGVRLQVQMDREKLGAIPDGDIAVICALLREDPRPAYHNDPERTYGMEYKDYEIKFTVSGNVLQVTDIRTADRRE